MAEQVLVFDVRGDQELFFALASLPDRVIERVSQTAFKVPANRIKDAAKENAPKKTGALKKAMKVRALPRQKGRVGVVIGTSRKQFYVGEEFYAGFQEHGWLQGRRLVRGEIGKAGFEDIAIKRIQALTDNLGNVAQSERSRRIQKIKDIRVKIQAHRFAMKADRRRRIPAKFFFRKAFDANRHITKEEMKRNILEAINIETAKDARRMSKKILNPTKPGEAQENRALKLLAT